MANVQLAVAGDETTQVILSVPGVQGPAGSNLPPSGTTNQVLYKQSSTDYDTAWSLVTSAMITDGTIVNGDINASAAIAGTKISPDFGSQNVVTTGTATAASFIPTSSGVPTNGLYLPSANNVAISTNGTGKLFVDASGNVGVNISPSARFHVVDTDSSSDYDANAILGTQTSIYKQIIHTNQSSGTNEAGLVFRAGTSSNIAEWGISTQRTGATSGDLIFRTRTGASTSQEFFRITSTGTVNIVGAGSAGSTQAVSFNGSAPVDSLVLTSGGLVGIGTSSPGSNLEVVGGTSTDGPGAELRLSSADQTIAAADEIIGSITFKNNDVSNGMTGYMAKIDAASNRLFDGDPASGMNLRFFAGTAADGVNAPPERMRLTSAGRLGIGTMSPAAELDVNGNISLRGNGTATRYLGLLSETNTYAGTLTLQAGGGSSGFGGGIVMYGHSHASYPGAVWIGRSNGAAGAIMFGTGGIGPGSEQMRLDDSGRLLVGTSTSPSSGDGQYARFVVQGNTLGAAGYISLQRTQSATLPLTSTSELGYINFGDNAGNSFASIQAFADADTANNDYPGRLVFSTTSDGQPSPTPRLTITSTGQVRLAGAGITFNGDTATANELDDYEEGTWTPNVGGDATYSIQVGTYTKIGRQVTASFDMSITTIGTGDTNRISGLPFAVSSTGEGRGATGYFASLATNVIALQCYAANSASFIYFNSMNASGATATQNPAIFGNSARVQGTVTYFV